MAHVLHIGYHKTATSWFQQCFYPAVTHAAAVPRRTVIEAVLGPSALHFEPAVARRKLFAAVPEARRLILCHEELSGNPHAGGLHGCLSKDAAHRLHAMLPESEVVVFVRHQLDMIAAVYKQYLRAGGTYAPARYLYPGRYRGGAFASSHKIPTFSFDHFDYATLVEHYGRLFGRERVHVFAYEALREDAPGFTRRFAARLGLEVDWEQVAFSARNISYGRRVVRLARVLNHLIAGNVADKRCVVDLLPSHRPIKHLLNAVNRTPLAGAAASPRELLGPAVAEEIEARYATSNRRLAELSNLLLASYGYPGVESEPAAEGSAAAQTRVPA